MLKRSILLFSFFLASLFCLTWEDSIETKVETINQELIETYYEEEKSSANEETYLGILEIPSIHLKRGFFAKTSPLNNVDENIELISSCNPNDDCDLVLASHSGSSPISFFKNLDQLHIHDKSTLDYNHKIYTYYLSKIENTLKDGSISLEKTNHNRLILTTCDKQNNSIQKIYIFEKEEA